MLSNYINGSTHIKVKCKIHNYEWDIYPSNLLKGRWCPICNLPYSEKVVYDYLINNNYNIKVQYTFSDLYGKNSEKLKFDFAILNENNNLLGLLEVDDCEHRYNTKQPRRIRARERDKIKNEYCKLHNISLYRLPFVNKSTDFNNYDWYYEYVHKKLNNYLLNINKLVV
jgi:hypothetical protein